MRLRYVFFLTLVLLSVLLFGVAAYAQDVEPHGLPGWYGFYDEIDSMQIQAPGEVDGSQSPSLGPGTASTRTLETASDWKIITIPGETIQGAYSSISVDQDGNPHISFMDATNPAVKYVRWNENSWDTDTIETLDLLAYPSTSLALSDNGQPQVAYPWNNPVRLGFAERDGQLWDLTHIDARAAPYYADLGLKADDEPCISYFVNRVSLSGIDHNIELLCRTAGSWPSNASIIANSVYHVSSLFEMARFHSLALDSQDRPHLSFTRGLGTHELRYTSHNTEAAGNVVDNAPNVGFYSSLALDSQGRPHISYYDYTKGNLKYAMLKGSQWILETVDSGGNVGSFTSIALDGNDKPHISYYDATRFDLKYAFWDGSQWNIETVDHTGSVGQYTSLSLDAAGNAHISYYDATNMKLKYATNLDSIKNVIYLPLVLKQ